MPKFPTSYVYEVDLEHRVCGQFKIVNYENLLFQPVKDLPLEACDGVFGFSTKDISPVLNWSRDRIKNGKNRCK